MLMRTFFAHILTSLIFRDFLFQLTHDEKAEVVANCDDHHLGADACGGEDKKDAAPVFYVAAIRATQRLVVAASDDGKFVPKLSLIEH